MVRLAELLLPGDCGGGRLYIDWNERRSVSELWALRDALKVQKTLLDDFDAVVDLITTTIGEVVFRVIQATPNLPDSAAIAGSITVSTRKLDLIGNFGGIVEAVMACCFSDEVGRRELSPEPIAKLQPLLTR